MKLGVKKSGRSARAARTRLIKASSLACPEKRQRMQQIKASAQHFLFQQRALSQLFTLCRARDREIKSPPTRPLG